MGLLNYFLRALFVTWIALSHLTGLLWNRLLKRDDPGGPQRLKMALEKVSGSFLKFGQILSLQVDTLPRPYCDALLDLLDRVPPFSDDNVRTIFQQELGKTPDQIYREFNYNSIAAASIGQVHEAFLEDGKRVAVKVQRPGIRKVFERDAVLLAGFVKIVFLFRIKTLYFLRDPVTEFFDWIQDELDYRTEARHAQQLRENATGSASKRIPKIHWDLTTSRVMTMDFLEGYSVREYLRIREGLDTERLQELTEIGFDPSTYVTNVIDNFVSDALKFGVFHADLHPANLLIMKDNQVGYVDFGIVGNLSVEARRRIIQMTLGLVRGQNDEIFSAFMAVSDLTDHADTKGFRDALETMSRRWYKEPAIGGIKHFGRSLTVFLIDLLTICRSYGILPRREMMKYIRSLFLTDGLVSRLSPGLDLGPQLQSLCKNYVMEDTGKKFLSANAVLPTLAEFSGWLQMRPDSLIRSLEKMERGELSIRIRTSGPKARQRNHSRTFWVVIAWLIAVTMVFLNHEALIDQLHSPTTWIALFFVGSWTTWLLIDLYRLTRE
jgi:ubiquinone biosynthesis protein